MEKNISLQQITNEGVEFGPDDTLDQAENTMSRRSALTIIGMVGLGAAMGSIGGRSFGSSAVAESNYSVGTSMFGESSNMFESNADFGFARNDYITAQVIEQEQEEPVAEEPKKQPEPKEKEKEEPKEKPKPADKGLEQFKSKELTKGVNNRIKNEGIPGKINAQKSVYKHAQDKTNVPWQLMAAINYREATLRPSLSMLDGSSLHAGVSQDGVKIYPNAKKDAVAAANILKHNAKQYYGVDITNINNLSEKDIANAILSYNRGAMYLNNPGGAMPVSKSPYVYNYINGKQMKWNRADSYNGSKKLNSIQGKKDSNLGALVIVSYLVQNS